MHRTCAAQRHAAAELGPMQSGDLADGPEQRHGRVGIQGGRDAVEHKSCRHEIAPNKPPDAGCVIHTTLRGVLAIAVRTRDGLALQRLADARSQDAYPVTISNRAPCALHMIRSRPALRYASLRQAIGAPLMCGQRCTACIRSLSLPTRLT